MVTRKTLVAPDATKQITREGNQQLCEKVTGMGRLRSETARFGEIVVRLDESVPNCAVGPELNLVGMQARLGTPDQVNESSTGND